MEEKLLDFRNRIVDKKAICILLDLFFCAFIAVMCFIKVNKGLDITDSAYSCTNFTALDSLDGMWYYSTFYANLLGHLFTLLPLGRTFLGLNIYTGLIKLLLALAAYFFFTRAVKVDRALTFAGVLVSVALSWCPTTILYNYLTYLFFFAGAAFLYLGLVREKTIYLCIAGFFLGSNYFVRLPNVVEAGLIVALWIYCIFEKKTFGECVKKTVACIEGYIAALIPGFILIQLTRGFSEYIKGIQELFAMTEESTSYSAISMIISIGRQYIETCKYAWIAVLALVVSALIFRTLPKKLEFVKYALCVIISVLCIFVLYKRGLFDLNFAWFGPVYRYGAMVLIFSMVCFLTVIFSKSMAGQDKLLAAISLMTILITPIGSNNDIYSNFNNLFFVLPVLLFFTCRFINTREWMKGIRAGILVMCAIWFLLSLKFGVTYVFRDGFKTPIDTEVKNNPQMAGMKTEKTNAEFLTKLSDVWSANNIDDGKVILFGDVCGLSFYMNTPVAISTAWPTLDSFSVAKFQADMDALSDCIDQGAEDAPAIVLSNDELHEVYGADRTGKQEILNNFIQKYNYDVLYTDDVLTILTVR